MKGLTSILNKLKISPRSKPEYQIFISILLETIPDFSSFYYYTAINPDDRIGLLPLIDQSTQILQSSRTGTIIKCPFCEFYTKRKYISKHIYDSHDGFQCKLCKALINRDDLARHRGECDISNWKLETELDADGKDRIKNNLAMAVLGQENTTLKHLESRCNLSENDLAALKRIRKLSWIPDPDSERPNNNNPTNSSASSVE